MPIYQIPNKDIGVIRTISGTTTALTVVALKNKSSGEIVARTTTDSSGEYSFTVDNNIPFKLVVADQNNFENLTEVDVESSYPYSWYSGGGYVNGSQQHCIVRLSTSNLYYPNGGGIVWTSMPSYRVIDTAGYTPTDPFSGGVVIGSYTETGIGEGAEIELGFAVAGDYVLTLGGNPREYTAEEKNFGSIINKVTVTSIGRAYQTPILWISGTSINHRIKSGDPLDGEYARTVNGTEYWAKESSTTIAYSLTTFSIPSYVDAYPSDYGSRIKEYYLNSINGWGEGYTYGSWTGNNVAGAYVQGTRFTAALPDGVDVTTNDDSTVSTKKTAFLDCAGIFDGVNPLGFYKNHGPTAYRAIIYGANPIVALNGPSYIGYIDFDSAGDNSNIYAGSPAWAVNNRHISEYEFNLLKGYFGNQLITGTLLNCVSDKLGNDSFTTAVLSNTINLFYQLGDAVYGELRNRFTLSTAIFGSKLVGDILDYWQQGKGTNLSSNDYAKRIKPILDKVEAARQQYAPNDGIPLTTQTYKIKNLFNEKTYTLDLTVTSGSYGLTQQ